MNLGIYLIITNATDFKDIKDSEKNKIISDITNKLNLSFNKAEKDIGIYKSSIIKMEQAKELLQEAKTKREERKEKIVNLINHESQLVNLEPDLSDNLLNELTDLVESPNLITSNFDKKFLNLPVEVLSTVMKNHQRYIPLLKKDRTFF